MLNIEKFTSFYRDLGSMNLADLDTIYRDDVVFVDPIAKHEGISSVHAYFERLLDNAEDCRFDIAQPHFSTTQGQSCILEWTMSYRTSSLNKGDNILVDGVTLLKFEGEKICYHRDYYDLGQMVYEQIPILGRLVKAVKKRLE